MHFGNRELLELKQNFWASVVSVKYPQILEANITTEGATVAGTSNFQKSVNLTGTKL